MYLSLIKVFEHEKSKLKKSLKQLGFWKMQILRSLVKHLKSFRKDWPKTVGEVVLTRYLLYFHSILAQNSLSSKHEINGKKEFQDYVKSTRRASIHD